MFLSEGRPAYESNLVTGASTSCNLERGSVTHFLDTGIAHDTSIDQGYNVLAQLVINWREQILARDFFVLFQKVDEYSWNLQHLAERAFSGCPPNKVSNWITVWLRHRVRPPALVEKLCDIKTNSLSQLFELATKKL
ncbi:RNA directed DNA polymerase reverse transcriptase [Echinococcus multilocularis]|uniref:RNA directed DNA polymerase reverse transcriptase n=1 Tax=Echinococcus multilocularis TaxID=6211 RepID=A0A0S4MI60_ECHMU|nr:RNA directed DNA polymerase reverse transcriptase [Echinococcus multilocularis]